MDIDPGAFIIGLIGLIIVIVVIVALFKLGFAGLAWFLILGKVLGGIAGYIQDNS